MHLPDEPQLVAQRFHDDMDFDSSSELSSPPSSIPSSPLSSAPNSPILPPGWRDLTPPPSQDNARDDMPPARKRRKVEPRVRTTQHLDLTSDTAQSDYDHRAALDILLKTLRKRRKIVVVAGAGISVSAGIPDFRSSDGLFRTLRTDHKLKASGKELFDASVYKDDDSTSSFHDMVRKLSKTAANAKPTPFHRLLARLAQEGRLLRLYTQNVDGIDTSMPPLATEIPLGHRAPWPQTIQVHGGLKKMVCQKCRHTADFEPHLFQGPKPPLCPECEVRDALRTSHAGKRSHGIGKLRPRMVLYNEHNPDEEAIGAVMTADLRSRPDAIIVVGTSMKIPGVKVFVKQMCEVVRNKRDGIAMWINQDPVPTGKDFGECWDVIVKGPCDEVARHASFKDGDDTSDDHLDEYTLSDVERVRSSQGDIEVVIPESPSKKEKLADKKTMLTISGMMTPPVSMDDEMSDNAHLQHVRTPTKGHQSPKAKVNVVIIKNPASSGRTLSDVLGKENKIKAKGRPGTSLANKALKKHKGTLQNVIQGKVGKAGFVNTSKATATETTPKVPLVPRSDVNTSAVLYAERLQQGSSSEPSPDPPVLSERSWERDATISPNGSIPRGMEDLLN